MKSMRPLEIIGGGLAGLSLGLALQLAGADVTLTEAGRYPRHRVCGEFIAGLATSTIERLGLAPLLADARQHHEVAWFVGDASAPSRVQRLPKPALGLSRYTLDARLAEAFSAAGGDLRVGTRATDLTPRTGRIIATGRRRARSDWLGLKCHVRHYAAARDLELLLGNEAYVGCSGIEGGETNICGLFRQRVLPGTSEPPESPHRTLLAYLHAAGLGDFAAKIEAAEIVPGSFSAVAAVSFDRSVAADEGRVAIGDARVMIPPFTGNGMAMAFQSAELALDPLLGYARGEVGWAVAQAAIVAAQRRRFRVRLAMADVLHPFLLRPTRQRWFAALNRARLLPFRPLYAALH